MNAKRIGLLQLIVLFLIGLPSAGGAAAIEEFYRGKKVSFLIGEAVGGGYDSYSRLLVNYLGRHIPGNPIVIPQNMPGAAGLSAANHLYVLAPKDGTVI